jgi:hypothetical protein
VVGGAPVGRGLPEGAATDGSGGGPGWSAALLSVAPTVTGAVAVGGGSSVAQAAKIKTAVNAKTTPGMRTRRAYS